MTNNREIENKIDGHRRAIREHIEKYNNYPHDYDKEFALKTIRRAQASIEELKLKASCYISSSSEDTWNPEKTCSD